MVRLASRTNSPIVTQWGANGLGDFPVVGDFDGDGRTDLAVVRPNDPGPGLLTWVIKYSAGGQAHYPFGGAPGDLPVAGDFDGDGRTDYALVRPDVPAHGDWEWVIKYSHGGSEAHLPFGAYTDGDWPVVGDFDGDGRSDLAEVHDNDTSTSWKIRYATGAANTITTQPGAPVLGDWNGDGKTDFAVARQDVPSAGHWNWTVRYAGTTSTSSVPWGSDNLIDSPFPATTNNPDQGGYYP